MRFDTNLNSWLIGFEEWLKTGLSKRQYVYLTTIKKEVKTIGYGSKGNPIEIILNTVPVDKREQIIKALQIGEQKHEQALQTATQNGAVVSDVAINQTARIVEVNANYIRTELVAKIENDYPQYLHYYFQYLTEKGAVVGYAQLCVVAQWLYERVQVIRSQTKTEREFRRYMRSLRMNFLEVKPELNLIRHIPANDRRFDEWFDVLIEKMDAGQKVYETIEIVRKGNTNAGRFTTEQKAVAEQIYCKGNLNDRQVYDRLIEHGQAQGWWQKNGAYTPITYGLLNGWLTENRDRLDLKRSDRIGFFQSVVPTIDRSYPTEKNYCWGIDGTAHNEHIKAYGTIRQHIYVVKVFDYATMRLLHVEVTRNDTGRESGQTMIDALKGAMLFAGHRPYLVQMDKGPGHKAMKRFLEDEHIHTLPSSAGISRGKLVEGLLGQVQRQIINTLHGWNGQNRTAGHRNSHPSQQFWTEGQQNARSFEVASQWLKTELGKIWNEHIIESMEGAPLNKTPDELWHERTSKTPELPYESLLYVAGKVHEVQKKVSGIDIQYANESWRYIPDIADTKKAAQTWLAIQNNTKVKVYVRNYGEPVAVFQGETYHGLWIFKERVPMFATFEGDTELYNKMSNFQADVEALAQEKANEATRIYEQQPYTAEVEKIVAQPLAKSRRRATEPKEKKEGFLDKNRLNELENTEKYNDFVTVVEQFEKDAKKLEKKPEYKEYTDPDTGEVFRLKINK